MTRWIESPCCRAAVVGMTDVTVHPRLWRDSKGRIRKGTLVDSMAEIRRAAKEIPTDLGEAYCVVCGEHVPLIAGTYREEQA